jgi:hypothetical protein
MLKDELRRGGRKDTMLTRYVFFEGEVVGDPETFRRTINRELLPMWQKMPHNTGVRLTLRKRGTRALRRS